MVPESLSCRHGHSFDVAKQGYVNLLTGSSKPGTADTPAMVAARDDFLGAGHYDPIADRLAELSAGAEIVADAGAGTGFYLGRALGSSAVGLALDISKHALRRAARAHPRIGAVVADVWKPLPVRDQVVDVLLNVFAPRNAAEFARVLKPDGMLVTVTPGPEHLWPLVDRLGLLRVDEDKEGRLAASLGDGFAQAVQDRVEFDVELGHKAVAEVVGMGPSAWHERETPIGALPDPVSVRVSVLITGWRSRW
ncbi:rRNA (guanine-N1)-methyltransferase [Acrocarpospora phusangensis]|uniref:rRNA (Guanine-N1)-methyltransferase n=2 Tax=Acrocarpospora phusangensis TaxID=1070424 RepID=A0A919QHD5_9ACTN|nr:rRNA (guanine-N1)-methyltransferase [Acrocarpospora phusangensis]